MANATLKLLYFFNVLFLLFETPQKKKAMMQLR